MEELIKEANRLRPQIEALDLDINKKQGDEKIAMEMDKDIDRLKLVSDRFGKIGSTPQLEKRTIPQ